MMVVVFVQTIHSISLKISLLSVMSSKAQKARGTDWELGNFNGPCGIHADKLFQYLEFNVDTVSVWPGISLGPSVSIFISKGVGNLDLSGPLPR